MSDRVRSSGNALSGSRIQLNRTPVAAPASAAEDILLVTPSLSSEP
jgi:hypothetical protein